MERDFYNDDFESLIKQKADQFRMYPSDKVWNEVNKSLHPGKKWYWYGFALLLSGLGLYSLNNLTAPKPASALQSKSEITASKREAREPAQLIPFGTRDFFASIKKPKREAESTHASRYLEPVDGYVSDILSIESSSPVATAKVISLPLIKSGIDQEDEAPATVSNKESRLAASIQNVPSTIDDIFLQLSPRPLAEISPAEESSPDPLVTKPEVDAGKMADERRINWLQEYAVYELAIPKVKRLSFQLTAAPTMTYRRLSGNKPNTYGSDIRSIPLAMNLSGDVNKLVNHKPAWGFEIGTGILYAASKNIALKAGLQFNFSRYSIQAFRSPTELTTIALNNSYGFTNDSISSFSSYRNFGGYAEKDIQNHYLQLSAPIGAELKLLGNKRLQLNIAATIQPTYLLNRDSYLITTDYKNYTRQPALTRKWNVSTAAEAYISYRTGGVRWQLGPQFRYQLLSTYNKEYPISEFLMEYGVKFGVAKTIR